MERGGLVVASEREKEYYGKQVIVASREGDCSIFRLEDSTGCAILTRYEVFPGITLIYNDVHMQEISVEETGKFHQIFEINHCREGRIEFETIKGEYIYVKKGDMAINTKAGLKNYSYFPICHYHGVTIEIDLSAAQECLPEIMKDIKIRLSDIKDRFCTKEQCFVFREKEQFEHLFSELYCVPEKIRREYYKIKIIEILLFLSVVDAEHECMQNKYYNKNQVALTKEIRNYMVTHLDEKITIDELSQRYHISATNLKKHFREVYGNSVYAYLKEYRIHSAAELLRNTDMEISKIAGMTGYDNASKFAQSFKSIIGINPNEYRKGV